MKKEMVINSTSAETRIAILEDGILTELYIERPEHERMVGDIYKGRIENIVEGIQAAFVNVGLKQNGFLSFTDMGREYSAIAERLDQGKGKAHLLHQKGRGQLRSGQEILVQVIKEPMGTKGARLTSTLSLPGRFLVLVPHDDTIGVSRKIVDPRERRRLRMLAKSIQPSGFGLIIRTVAVGKDVETIRADMETLIRKWKSIEDGAMSHRAPDLLHKDLGITSSVVRDLFSPDIDRLVVDSRSLFRKSRKYLKEVAPGLISKLELYRRKTPIFDAMKIEEEIEKSLSRKVWLKSGGYIVFDQTEAMGVIDVNSGRSVGERDHERHALKTNLEACRVIARQLRIRDIGGIIVIDFIDLAHDKNREKLISEFKRELKKDRAAFDVLPMSAFGLVQMTRGRVRPSLLYQYSESCPRCDGLGRIPIKSAILTKIERKLRLIRSESGRRRMVLTVHPDVETYLTEGIRSRLRRLMLKYLMTIKVKSNPQFKDDQFTLAASKDDKEEKTGK